MASPATQNLTIFTPTWLYLQYGYLGHTIQAMFYWLEHSSCHKLGQSLVFQEQSLQAILGDQLTVVVAYIDLKGDVLFLGFITH